MNEVTHPRAHRQRWEVVRKARAKGGDAYAKTISVSYLEENPKPSEDEVRVALEGNLCRCTGYHNIVKSVMAAAK